MDQQVRASWCMVLLKDMSLAFLKVFVGPFFGIFVGFLSKSKSLIGEITTYLGSRKVFCFVLSTLGF